MYLQHTLVINTKSYACAGLRNSVMHMYPRFHGKQALLIDTLARAAGDTRLHIIVHCADVDDGCTLGCCTGFRGIVCRRLHNLPDTV